MIRPSGNSSCMDDASDQQLEKGANCLKSLAHPLRLKVVAVLGAGEASVSQLLRELGTSQPNVSQHLAQMRDKGVLSARRDGNQIYYRVKNPKLFELLALVRELFCEPDPVGDSGEDR